MSGVDEALDVVELVERVRELERANAVLRARLEAAQAELARTYDPERVHPGW